jgi:hypothetical protein
MTVDAAAIRAELAETRERMANRDALITAGSEAGIPKTELAELSGLSRQHIYEVLTRWADAKRRADESEVGKVAAMWQLGQVVEDRWGLRWRADITMKLAGEESHRWFCRSCELRTSISHEKMATRGPLKKIRVDKIFAGPFGSPQQKQAVAERKAGAAEDAAVMIAPHEDPEPA